MAEIQLLAEILRYGFYFIDTPGLGSIIRKNTRTTEAFLPEADAFILVSGYESPLSEEEFEIFKTGIVSGRRIFVVLNKQDTVSFEDRQAAIAFVQTELARVFDTTPPQLFSISSTEALDAKNSGDPARLQASGIVEFENRLVEFLLTEKNHLFLRQTCERVRNFLHELPSLDEVKRLNAQLTTLEQEIGKEPVKSRAASGLRQQYSGLYRLQSCEICNSVDQKMWDFLCQYQYAISTDVDEQQKFSARGGFCSFHTWQYHLLASPYGICNAYHGLLDRLSGELSNIAQASPPDLFLERLHALLPTHQGCALCNIRDEAERSAIADLAIRLQQASHTVPDELPALCLSHLPMLADELRDDEVVKNLVFHQSIVLKRYSEDMQRYALKFDAVRRYAVSQEEIAVAESGLLSIVGRKRVNCPPASTDTVHPHRTEKSSYPASAAEKLSEK